jgi:hypothetical protein
MNGNADGRPGAATPRSPPEPAPHASTHKQQQALSNQPPLPRSVRIGAAHPHSGAMESFCADCSLIRCVRRHLLRL